MTKRILILAANPKDTSRLRLDQEVREITNSLERAQRRDEFILKQQWAVRPVDVRRAMLDFKPNIVHFCGHGGGEEGIAFEDETGSAKLVTTAALAEFFKLFANRVECVVLNACYSEIQAKAIAQNIDFVVGMKKDIGDNAATEFAGAFYDALGAGESIEFAHELARNAILWAGMPEHLTPILDTRTLELHDRSRFLLSSDIALQYFARKYPKDTGKNLLRVGHYSYPIVIYPAEDKQALNPESVLSQESDVLSLQDVELIAPNDEFRRVREHLGASLYDGRTYTMKKFDEGPPLRLECGLGSYFQMLHTCDSLMWELLVGLRDVEKSGGSLEPRLKDRNKLHKTVADPIRDGTGRSVAIGGETAFAFIDPDGQVRIFVRLRSEEGVAVYPNALDVIPSYMFQPFTPDYEAEFSVAHNFYREYLEEMFDVAEVYNKHYGWIYGRDEVKYLKGLEAKGLARLYLTGVAVNLVDLRPEICTLYLVRTPEWYEHWDDKLKFNLEYVTLKQERVPKRRGHAEPRFGLCEEELIEEKRYSILRPDSMTPSGAAGFWLAYRLLGRMDANLQVPGEH